MNTMANHPPDSAFRPGSIDLHSHLLPGVDDGCTTLEDTLTCISLLKNAGYVGSICTPHILPEKYLDNTPEKLLPRFQQLQQQLRDAGVDYQLWLGGELTARDYTLGWIQDNGVPTLGDSRYVLMDVWAFDWPDWFEPLLSWLIERDYRPIIAHPERFKACKDEVEPLARLKEMGIMLQGNFPSLVGKYGPEVEHFARKILQAGLYDVMATDGHNPGGVTQAMQGREIFSSVQRQQSLQHMIDHMPRSILGLGSQV